MAAEHVYEKLVTLGVSPEQATTGVREAARQQLYAQLVELGVSPEQAAAGVQAACRQEVALQEGDNTRQPVHVIDQSGQPYGSRRLCCNWCGLMATPGMRYVISMSTWSDLPEAERCSSPSSGA